MFLTVKIYYNIILSFDSCVMKIKKLTLKNHSILGNIELDFTNDDGLISQTVLLAWENGTWKTQILEIFNDFCNLKYYDGGLSDKEKRIFEVSLDIKEVELLQQVITINSTIINSKNSDVGQLFVFEFSSIECIIYKDSLESKNKISASFVDWINIPKVLWDSDRIKFLFKGVFAQTNVNFNFEPVKQVTRLDVDQPLVGSVKSNHTIWQIIAQLFVNIYQFDNADVVKWGKNNPWKLIPDEVFDIRQKRFKEAFSVIFNRKQYEEVEDTWSQFNILFTESGKKIYLDDLSSWEKQIVFRWSFLLKDRQNTQWAIVLLDEPEISLHPSWQLKIVDFYKKLFTDNQNNQTAQIFIATHSPFIIHNSQRFNDKVISLAKKEDWTIYVETEPTYFGYTEPEFIKKSFDLNDFIVDKPIILTEWKNYQYLKKAKEIFAPTLAVEIKEIDKNGSTELKSIYKVLFETKINHNNIFFIWDCDANKEFSSCKETEFLKPILLQQNKKNTKSENWIENMFDEKYLPNLSEEEWWIEKTYAWWFKKVKEINKSKLQDYILSQATKESFANFEWVFQQINKLLWSW